MTDQPSGPRVSISWSARREGNEGWVLETYEGTDQRPREFGPMRANIVPAFIESRRKMFAMRMERRGHKQISEDTIQ